MEGVILLLLDKYFKNQLHFKAKYQRNNKRSGLKNIRCYPFCHGNVHQTIGFCGSSIDVDLWASLIPDYKLPPNDIANYENVLNKANLRAWGEFCLCEAVSPTKIGDIIDMKAAIALERSKTNQFLPWYSGLMSDQIESENSTSNQRKFLASASFSSQSKGWHYAWSSSKHTANSSHCFRVYVFTSFVNNDGHEMLQCIGIFNSPQFKIQSTRGATPSEKNVLDPAAPVNVEENKSIYSTENLHKIQSNIPQQQLLLEHQSSAMREDTTTSTGFSSDDVDDHKGKKKRQIRPLELTEAQLEDVKLLRLLSALRQLDQIKASATALNPEKSNSQDKSMQIQSIPRTSSFDAGIDLFSGQLNDVFEYFADELGTNNFVFDLDEQTIESDLKLSDAGDVTSSFSLQNSVQSSPTNANDSIILSLTPPSSNSSEIVAATTTNVQKQSKSSQSRKVHGTINSINELAKILEEVASYLVEEESFSKLLRQSLSSQSHENQRNKYQNVLKVFESHINEYLLRIGTTLDKINKLLLKHGKSIQLDSSPSEKTQKRTKHNDTNAAHRRNVRKVDIMRGEDPAVKASISGKPAPLTEVSSKLTSSSEMGSSLNGNSNERYGEELVENKRANIIIASEPHHILCDSEYHPTFTSPYFDSTFVPDNGGDPDISGAWVRTSEGENNMEKLRQYRVMPWVTRKVIGAMEGKFKFVQPRKGVVKVLLKQKLLSDGCITYYLDGKERAFELDPPMPGDPPLAISKQSWAVGNAVFLRHYFTMTARITRIFWKMPDSPLLLSRYVQESYTDGAWKCDMVVEQISEPDLSES